MDSRETPPSCLRRHEARPPPRRHSSPFCLRRFDFFSDSAPRRQWCPTARRYPPPRFKMPLCAGARNASLVPYNRALSRRGFAGPLLDHNSRRLPGLGTLHWFLERRWRPAASDEAAGGTGRPRREDLAGFVREQSFDTPQRGERAGHGCPNNYYETRTLRLG